MAKWRIRKVKNTSDFNTWYRIERCIPYSSVWEDVQWCYTYIGARLSIWWRRRREGHEIDEVVYETTEGGD